MSVLILLDGDDDDETPDTITVYGRLSGIVQAVYPNGPESAANLSGSVHQSKRISGIVSAG